MNITEIFDMAREQAGGVTSAQFPNATLLPYANLVYKKIANAIIRKVNEKYFYDILTANTVANQNEYTLKTSSGTIPWLKKIITVNVKWLNTDTYYTKYEPSSTDLSTQSIDEQVVSPDQWNFFEVKDGSIFLYPAPTTSITNWLVVEAILTLPDLEVDSTEDEIFPNNTELRDYHEIIALWIVPYIYGKLKQIDLKIAAKQEFNMELETMLDELSDRVDNDLQWTLPNGSIYK